MYAGLQTTASNLLQKFGRIVTLTKPAYTGEHQEFNPVTGEWETVAGETPGAADTGSVKAVFVGITAKWTDKFTIEQGDSVALVSAGGLEPEQNDVLDGWTVLAVEAVKPADVAVMYKCHVRKQ